MMLYQSNCSSESQLDTAVVYQIVASVVSLEKLENIMSKIRKPGEQPPWIPICKK